MTDGLDSARSLRADAEEIAPRPRDEGPQDPHDGGPPHEDDGGLDERIRRMPVVPLGVNGKANFYLDALGQMHELPWKDHSLNNIKGMFGAQHDLLCDMYPRYNKEGERVEFAWRPELAANDLMAAASRKGVFQPFQKIRGPGAWLGEHGALILHCGDRIYFGPDPAAVRRAREAGEPLPHGRYEKPGLHGGFVYPSAPPLRRPDLNRQPAENTTRRDNPGQEIVDLLKTWNWRRRDNPHLLLGIIVAGMIGGALKVRPTSWITGDFGTGKSSAQELVKFVHGDNAVIAVSDATAAGVWQQVKYASLPVELDEQEPEGDNRVRYALIKLARQAATGGIILRGGADHVGTAFTARSAFMFGSILIPPLKGQDRSRIITLDLGKLPEGQKPPATNQKMLAALGARLLRRVVDQWWRLEETLQLYRDMLMASGHTSRGADVFGTALACADVALYDAVPDSEVLAGWSERLRASDLFEMRGEENVNLMCWQHLQASVVDPFRSGGRRGVSEWVERAVNSTAKYTPDEAQEARRVLQVFGMKVVDGGQLWKLYGIAPGQPFPDGWQPKPPYLAVGNSHPGVAQIFKDTLWRAESGAQGVWVQSLSRLDGAPPRPPPKPLWFGGDDSAAIRGASHRVTLVSLYADKTGEPTEGATAPAGAAQGGTLSTAPPGHDDDIPF